MLSPQSAMNVAHISANRAKYLGLMEIIDGIGLCHTMQFQCNWSVPVVLQFYATCHFGSDRAITWMTDDTVLGLHIMSLQRPLVCLVVLVHISGFMRQILAMSLCMSLLASHF